MRVVIVKTHLRSLKSVTAHRIGLHITLVGCGAIAEHYYLPALARLSHSLDALVLVDQNIDRATKLASGYGAAACVRDYREVLNRTDGVIVAVPTHLHHPIAMEFLARGIPVLCEKPLAESVNKAKEMVEQARRMGVTLATNYQQRLWPQFARARELFANRSLGDPVHISYHVGEVFGWPTVSGFYFNSEASSRGIVRDRGAHVMDHICWWLGAKPAVVSSEYDSFGGSEAVARIEFEHKRCTGEVRLSWVSGFPCKFLVEFERGSLEGEVYYPQSVLLKIGTRKVRRTRLARDGYSDAGDRIVSNFVAVVTRGAAPLIPGSDVLDSIAFIDECYAAASRFEMPWYESLEEKGDT